MASRRISAPRGFTLAEVLVVVGLITTLAGFGLVVSMQTYRSYSFRGERDALLATLARARSASVNNLCFGASCAGGVAHGVHLDSGAYVLFQGDSYASRDPDIDEVIPVNYPAMATTAPSTNDIVFAPLSGTTTPADISLVDLHGQDSSVISVNPEGQITWTN